MPDLGTTYKAIYRTAHYRVDGFLYIDAPPAIFKARVNQSSFTYPLTTITFDNVTLGAYTDIQAGFTLLIGTTEGGDDLGRHRVKSATSTTITIPLSSQGIDDGTVNPADNSYLTVLEERRVWGYIPYIGTTGILYKDSNIAYSDQNYNMTPFALIGGGCGWAAHVDPATSTVTVTFSGEASYGVSSVVDGSITDYLWDVGHGTATGAIDEDTCEIEFPVGRSYVSLTVTSAAGKTHTRYLLVVTKERGDFIQNFNISINREVEGQTATIEIYDNIPATTYPDGATVIYFEDEYFGTQQTSIFPNADTPVFYGDLSFAHIKFAGYLHNEQQSVTADRDGLTKQTSLQCVDPLGRIKLLPGFPIGMGFSYPTPANWQQLPLVRFDWYYQYLMRWHSNICDLTDVSNPSGMGGYIVISMSTNGANLYEQVDSLCKAVGWRCTGDSKGRIYGVPYPQLLPETGTTVRTTVETITYVANDLSSFGWTHTRPPLIHWMNASAILTAGSLITVKVVLCIAPGSVPGQGETSSTIGQQVVLDQSQLNTRVGYMYALQNAHDRNFESTFTHAGDHGDEPAFMEWYRHTITSSESPQRGQTFSGRFLLLSVAITYDARAGTKDKTCVWEKESIGTPAATKIPETLTTPEYTPPYTIYPIAVPTRVVEQWAYDGAGFFGSHFAAGNYATIEYRGNDVWRVYSVALADAPTWSGLAIQFRAGYCAKIPYTGSVGIPPLADSYVVYCDGTEGFDNNPDLSCVNKFRIYSGNPAGWYIEFVPDTTGC